MPAEDFAATPDHLAAPLEKVRASRRRTPSGPRPEAGWRILVHRIFGARGAEMSWTRLCRAANPPSSVIRACRDSCLRAARLVGWWRG